MSDDQDLASFREAMPATARLARSGTTFADFVVTTPSCCPSRASFLTGEYAHNNGVLANSPGYRALREKENVLPAWLWYAGYRTAEFGKFMNLYENESTGHGTVAAPGWDVWEPLLAPYAYFDFALSIDGERREFGTARRKYLTDVLARRAVRFIEGERGHRRPFFAWVNLFAPHVAPVAKARTGGCAGSAVPAPRDRERFRAGTIPTPRSFGEPNVTDKPFFVRTRPSLSRERSARFAAARACRLAAVASVDRAMARIHRALERTGQLDDTLLVFTSDNGWLEGEHRIEGKALPYEEAVHVPLVVWAPPRLLDGARAPRVIREPTANIDLAPTIIAAAGTRTCRTRTICRTVDGRSLVPLLRDRMGAWPDVRPVLLESREGDFGVCSFEAVRTRRYTYAEYAPFEEGTTDVCASPAARELYDRRVDPAQLRNLMSDPDPRSSRIATGLAGELALLRGCRGAAPAHSPRADGACP